MMVSVPEFAYPSLWIFIAMGFVLKKMTDVPEYRNWLIADDEPKLLHNKYRQHA
jgi:hypothetical protein